MRSSLFEALPSDLIRYISQYLHLNGPSVKLIEGEPNDEEKKAVTATALNADGKADSNRPDLSTYHLIVSNVTTGAIEYKIGFCKKKNDGSLEYTIHTLDEKSPLLRYVREDLTHREYSKLFPFDSKEKRYQTHSTDRVLLRYLEKEIKAAGGLTYHRLLNNRTRLAGLCQKDRAIMNAGMRDNEGKKSTNQVVQQSILQEFFKDLCDHESFHEIEEARALLERFPQLLLSQFSGDIKGCSPELTLHGFTLIQKAYLQGNWFFYEMALDVIEQSKLLSEEKKAFYKKDVLAQIKVVDEGRLEWTLDNLLNRGVRIIDADTMANNASEKKRFIEEIVERNGYYLMIKKEVDAITSCSLGYCCPNTKKYMTHDISTMDPLFGIAGDLYQRLRHANDGYNNHHSHCFTRDHRDLALVKAVLDGLKVPTLLRQAATPLNFAALLAALQEYIQNWNVWSMERRRDHLHGSIYAECRLFSGILWQLWMSEDLPWTSDEEEMQNFVTGKKSGAVDLNYFKERMLPLSSFLGDKFYAQASLAHDRPRRLARRGLLKSILIVESQKRINFTADLQANLNQKRRRRLAF